MAISRRIGRVVTTVAVAAAFLACAQEAVAQVGKRTDSQIYQQRTADGRIVFTDRPLPGAVTQRTWQTTPEDAVAARQRREEGRLEALAVSERIQREIEAQRQRDHELDLARLQLAEGGARLDAERARADAAAQPAFVFVRTPWRFAPSPQMTRPRMLRPAVRPGWDLDTVPR